MQCSKFSVLTSLSVMAKMMRNYLFLLLFLVSSIKNKIFVGEYSAKEAQHLFENELSYLRHYQFIYTMEHILQIR